MTVETEKLLVLKAFYMGHAISEKTHNIPVALTMVNKAIQSLQGSFDNRALLRLLFYVLLKAEILRQSPDVLAIRAYAREISQRIGGNVFDYFMAIEDGTQTRKKVYGLQVGVIGDEGIKPTVSYTVGDGFNIWLVRYDAACRALGVDERRLTERETHFLRKVTLREMLEKHEIELPSSVN